MLTSRNVVPLNRSRGGWLCSGQRISRSFSSVDCLNRSTRILSKSETTENILTWKCSKQVTDAMYIPGERQHLFESGNCLSPPREGLDKRLQMLKMGLISYFYADLRA